MPEVLLFTFKTTSSNLILYHEQQQLFRSCTSTYNVSKSSLRQSGTVPCFAAAKSRVCYGGRLTPKARPLIACLGASGRYVLVWTNGRRVSDCKISLFHYRSNPRCALTSTTFSRSPLRQDSAAQDCTHRSLSFPCHINSLPLKIRNQVGRTHRIIAARWVSPVVHTHP